VGCGTQARGWSTSSRKLDQSIVEWVNQNGANAVFIYEQDRPLARRRCWPQERIRTGLQLLTRPQGGKHHLGLDQWLQNPTGDVHGSEMFITVPNAGDRQNVIAYLETLK
jgi:hypothetical protein